VNPFTPSVRWCARHRLELFILLTGAAFAWVISLVVSD